MKNEKLNLPWRVERSTEARPSDRRLQIVDAGGTLICEMAGTSIRDQKVAQEIVRRVH